MKKKQEDRDLFFFQGGITGVINACICSLGFVLVDEITTVINSIRMDFWKNYEFNLAYIGLSTIVSSLVSLFPAFVGGCWLAMWIKLDAKTGHVSLGSSVGKGMLVGAVLGGLVCFFIGMLLFGFMLSSGKGSLSYFPLRAIEAIVFAILAGGLTGRKLMFLARNSSDEHKNNG